MTHCPYCGGPVAGRAALPSMSKRKMGLYEAIAAAGRDGADRHALLRVMYKDNPPPGGPIVLRVQIHELNKLIAPLKQRVKGRGSIGYVLESVQCEP